MSATIKPTKAVRAAAPDLFGQPAYFNEPSHQGTLVEQLKSVGMLPAAWALEDLLEAAAERDELHEELFALQRDHKRQGVQLDAANSELDRYKTFFEDTLRAFEEAPNGGRWPAAQPDDYALRNAIDAQFSPPATPPE